MKKIGLSVLLLGCFLLFFSAGAAQADLYVKWPVNSVMHPDGSVVFIPDTWGNIVNVIDAFNPSTSLANIPVAGAPGGMAVSPDGTKLCVTAVGGQGAKLKIYTLNDPTYQNISWTDVVLAQDSGADIYRAFGVAITPDSRYAYVVEQEHGKIYVVDLQTKTKVKTITAPKEGLFGVALKPDGTRLYAGNQKYGEVYVYNIENKTAPVILAQSTISGCHAVTYLMAGDVPVTTSKKISGQTFVVTEEATYLFVKVNELTGPKYLDVKIFDTKDDAMASKGDISIFQDSQGPEFALCYWMDNHSSNGSCLFDGMALSPDGAFLYVTHWNEDYFDMYNPPELQLVIAVYSASNPANHWGLAPMSFLTADSILVGRGSDVSNPGVVPDCYGQAIWKTTTMGAAYFVIGNNGSDIDNGIPYPKEVPFNLRFLSPAVGSQVESASFSWKKATDQDSPTLYYLLDYITAEAVSTNKWQTFHITKETSVDVTDWNLFQPNKSYYVRVRAYDETDVPSTEVIYNYKKAGDELGLQNYLKPFFKKGLFSTFAYTGPFTKKINPPSHLMVSPEKVTMTTAVASWWAVAEAEKYELTVLDVAANKWLADANAPLVTSGAYVDDKGETKQITWLDITGLSPGRQYSVKARAVKGQDKSSFSGSILFTASTVLGVPENLTFDHITMITAQASWWATPGADKYKLEIYREKTEAEKAVSPGQPWIYFTTVTTSGVTADGKDFTWLKINGLTPGWNYMGRIKAIRTQQPYAQESQFSDWKVFAASTKLEAPKGIMVSDTTMFSTMVSWESVGGAKGYKVELMRKIPNGWFIDTSVVTKGAAADGKEFTWVKAGGLQPGASYEARVRAFIPPPANKEENESPDFKYPQDGPWGYSQMFEASKVLAKPKNLVISDVTMTTAQASWWAVDGATGYVVSVSKALAFWDPLLKKWIFTGDWQFVTQEAVKEKDDAGQPKTWFTLKGLGVGKTYRVSVAATREVDPYKQVGPFCDPQAFTTITTLVTPEGITVYQISMDSAWISWEAVGGAKGYRINYLEASVPFGAPPPHDGETVMVQGTTTDANGVEKEATWVKLPYLNPGIVYHARVQAFIPPGENYAQDGPWGYSQDFTASTTLEAPKGVMIYDIGATTAWVSWEVVGGATGYRIWYAGKTVDVEGQKTTWALIPPVGGDPLLPNSPYYVMVKAKRESGLYSPQYSSYAQAKPFPFTTALVPPAPKGIKVYDIGYASAWVSWESVGDVKIKAGSKYLVKVSYIDPGGNPRTLQTETVTTKEGIDITWVKVSQLLPNTEYSLQVQSYVDQSLQSAWSTPPVTFKTLNYLPMPDLNIKDITMVSALAYWGPVDGATSYELSVYDQNDGVWIAAPDAPLVTKESTMIDGQKVPFTWKKITGLKPGHTYQVTMEAVAGSVKSKPAEIFFETSYKPLPVKEDSITPYNVAMTHAEVSWEAIEGCSNYEVYYIPQNSPAAQTLALADILADPHKVATKETWVSIHGIHPEETIWYVVYVRGKANGYWSDLSPTPGVKLVRIIPEKKPLPPTHFQVSAESITVSSATVFWYAEEDANNGYTVAYSTDSAADPNVAPSDFTTITTYGAYTAVDEQGVEVQKPYTWVNLKGLKPGTTYYAWVRSKNKYVPTGKLTNGDYTGDPDKEGKVGLPFTTTAFGGVIDDYEGIIKWPDNYSTFYPENAPQLNWIELPPIEQPLAVEGEIDPQTLQITKAMKIKYNPVGIEGYPEINWSGWGGYYDEPIAIKAADGYTYLQYSIKSGDNTENTYRIQIVVEDGTPNGKPYSSAPIPLRSAADFQKKTISLGALYHAVIENGKVKLLTEETLKKELENAPADKPLQIRGYNFVYEGGTLQNVGYHYFDNIKLEKGSIKQVSFDIYDTFFGNENWIAVPFEGVGEQSFGTLLNVGLAIAQKHPSPAPQQEVVTVEKFDPSQQAGGGMLLLSYDPADPKAISGWVPTVDTGNAVELGEMLKVYLDMKLEQGFGNLNWQIEGQTPSTINFLVVYDKVSGNTSWISVPAWKTGGLKGSELAQKIESNWGGALDWNIESNPVPTPPGVIIEIRDNASQMTQPVPYYKAGGVWQPVPGFPDKILEEGHPYIVYVTPPGADNLTEKAVKNLGFEQGGN